MNSGELNSIYRGRVACQLPACVLTCLLARPRSNRERQSPTRHHRPSVTVGQFAGALGALMKSRSLRLLPPLPEAIFPFYIIHQTMIVVVAHDLAKLRLALGLEAAILVSATVASCVLIFEIVRRISWLRPWFGLKRPPPSERVAAAPDAPTKPVHA
jgi:hypothetical protein